VAAATAAAIAAKPKSAAADAAAPASAAATNAATSALAACGALFEPRIPSSKLMQHCRHLLACRRQILHQIACSSSTAQVAAMQSGQGEQQDAVLDKQ
jgi:hypothetical protein